MLDEGHLSDSKGNRVDFTNCLIILTSNIGQQHILEGYKEARALSASNEKAGTTETAAGGAAEDGNGGKEPAAAATGGFKGSGKSPRDILKRMRQSVMKEVLGYFKPQVIGRMSEIIVRQKQQDNYQRRQIPRQAGRHRLTDRWIDRYTYRQSDRSTGTQTDRRYTRRKICPY